MTNLPIRDQVKSMDPHIREYKLDKTKVTALIASAYKNPRFALACLGTAQRIAEKLLTKDPIFANEQLKKIEECRRYIIQKPPLVSEITEKPVVPPRSPITAPMPA
ncbi:MAG: hypothetical protein ACPL06_02145 [Candidatus Anstonellales archaeon]